MTVTLLSFLVTDVKYVRIEMNEVKILILNDRPFLFNKSIFVSAKCRKHKYLNNNTFSYF